MDEIYKANRLRYDAIIYAMHKISLGANLSNGEALQVIAIAEQEEIKKVLKSLRK